MRTGRPKPSLVVTAEERRQLESPEPSRAIGAVAGAPCADRARLCRGAGQQERGETLANVADDGL